VQSTPQQEVDQPRPERSRLRLVRTPSPEPDLSVEELTDAVEDSVTASIPSGSPSPVPITEISEASFVRDSTGLAPLDHVLGGGLVEASVVLLASPPGIGKSSLTLQTLAGLGHRCLYVTGEETLEQIAGTARRVGALTPRLFVLCEHDIATIFAHARTMRAQTIAIDSIQKMTCADVGGRAGSPGQLKECTARLVTFAKKNRTATWIIGHVNGDGEVGGPKTLEHDVDVVLELSQGAKLEGNERILRCPDKNRFGPTNVVGHFELTATGFVVIDPDGWNEEL
jgi:DNA repair protein RadA/Sms